MLCYLTKVTEPELNHGFQTHHQTSNQLPLHRLGRQSSRAVRAIIQSLTGNENFPDPSHSLAVITAARDEFEFALSNTFDGGKRLTLLKNARRAELVNLIRHLAGFVSAKCDGDLTKLIGSGFPMHKPTRHAVGYLAVPATPTLRHGVQSGTLIAITKRPYGAKICNWDVRVSESPEVSVQTVQTTGGRVELEGLIPGQRYRIKVNAIGKAGPSDWSGSAQLIVI